MALREGLRCRETQRWRLRGESFVLVSYKPLARDGRIKKRPDEGVIARVIVDEQLNEKDCWRWIITRFLANIRGGQL